MVGSTTAGAWTFISSDCCVVLIDVCDVPIPRPDESYRVCVCTSLSVIRYNKTFLNVQRGGRRGQIVQKWKKIFQRRLILIIACPHGGTSLRRKGWED